MHFEPKSIAIGVAAGIAAALLSVGSVVQTSLSLVLFFVAPLPVMVAGLGWGPVAGLAGVITAFLAVAGFASALPAAIVAVTITVPGAAMAYLASLAKLSEKGTMDWYPLSGILFRTVTLVATGFIMIGLMVGYGADFAQEFSDELIKQFMIANPQMVITDDVKASFAHLLTGLLPFIQPATWLLVLLGNFYMALHLARISGRLKRPRDFWPLGLRLPKLAVTILAVALALAFLGGQVGYAAAVPAGTLLMAFACVGLAAFHASTLGKAWRFPALWLTYIAIALIGFILIPFLLAGLLTTAKPDSPLTPLN